MSYSSQQSLLRIGLGVVLSILIVVVFALGGSSKPSKSAGDTTTTTPEAATTTIAPQLPTTNAAAASFGRRGCNLNTSAAKTPNGVGPIGVCRIVEIGDSLGVDLAIGMQNQLRHSRSIRFVGAAKVSTGLVHTEFYDWSQHLRKMMSRYHPQLVIVCVGADDEQGIDVGGTAEPFGSKAWQKAYAARVLKIVSIATSHDARVLWVGLPAVRPFGYRQGLQLINALDKRVATSVKGVTFLPTWAYFAKPDGTIRLNGSVNHSWQALRTADGIHFTSTGENVFGTYVTTQMAQIFHVAIVPAYPQVLR